MRFCLGFGFFDPWVDASLSIGIFAVWRRFCTSRFGHTNSCNKVIDVEEKDGKLKQIIQSLARPPYSRISLFACNVGFWSPPHFSFSLIFDPFRHPLTSCMLAIISQSSFIIIIMIIIIGPSRPYWAIVARHYYYRNIVIRSSYLRLRHRSHYL